VLKNKLIIQTKDEKGNYTSARFVISHKNRVLVDYETQGVFQIELPQGVYNVKTIKCLEYDQERTVDRSKQTLFILNTDCISKGV
jgi:penicillin V acylase-like amidase (Ntn superfamily)